jgi:hypothetical protein
MMNRISVVAIVLSTIALGVLAGLAYNLVNEDKPPGPTGGEQAAPPAEGGQEQGGQAQGGQAQGGQAQGGQAQGGQAGGAEPAEGPERGRDYQLINIASGLALDSGENQVGTDLFPFERNDTDNQKWTLEDMGGGQVRYKSVAAQLCMRVKDNSGTTGGGVELGDCGSTAEELWTFGKADGGSVLTNTANQLQLEAIALNGEQPRLEMQQTRADRGQAWALEPR